MQELGTIMQENIGIKMIIMNNNFLGMVRQWQELFYNERYSSTPLVNPDFTTIASAYGIKSRLVNEREELDGAINEMLADDKSFLLIVNVDMKELIYPMIPAGGSVTNILIN
jgi:acetolactate synthase-1/2/3 large subunit